MRASSRNDCSRLVCVRKFSPRLNSLTSASEIERAVEARGGQGPDPRRTFGVTGFLFELAYREGVLCLFGGWSNAPWPGEVHGP